MRNTSHSLKVDLPLARRAALSIAGVVLAAAALCAQAPPRDAASDAQKIFTSVMSPYCPGLLLADCPSPAAFELRADIRRRLDAGEPAADIERDLYRKFGDVIRAAPPPTGWGAVLWTAPAVALASTLALLIWFLARQSRAEREPLAGSGDAGSEERLEEELDRIS
jgi:cytochrome c-type biogenesis protein CcmH